MNVEVSQLRDSVDRFERFLLEQVNRLEETLNVVEARAAAATGLSLTREFAEQRQRWEAERALERARLEAEAARLIEAWQRLEVEQRRGVSDARTRSLPDSAERDCVGISQASFAPVSRPVSDTFFPTPLDVRGNRRESVAQGRTAFASAPASSALPSRVEDAGMSEEMVSAEMAALQFQQMRREMQRHRCRS